MLRVISRVVAGATLAFSVLSVSGCLVNRIQTVQQQACEFDENFRVTDEDGIGVTFLDPVLYYEDVAFIAGLAPQLEQQADNRYRASYLIRKAGDADRLDIPLKLLFEMRSGKLVLSRISWHSPIPIALDDIDWSQLAGDMCDTGIPSWRARMEVPIPEFNRSLIPTRAEIIELGGTPTATSNDGSELLYRFVLEGANDDELTGTLRLVYDTSGQNLLRTRTRFYRYVTGADFERGMAWGKITL